MYPTYIDNKSKFLHKLLISALLSIFYLSDYYMNPGEFVNLRKRRQMRWTFD